MLQPFTEQRRRVRRRAEQEAAGAGVGASQIRSPTLEAEHRIEDVERHHRHAAMRVFVPRR
jgi:hypothetical protein